MPILQKKHPDISPDERYQYLSSQSLHSYEVEYIFWLEFKIDRSPEEERILDLMYDSETRRCAEVIVHLEGHGDTGANGTLNFLLNTEISEDVRFFIAAQYRKNALARSEYKSWLRFYPKSDIEALWYPKEYHTISFHITHLQQKTIRTLHEEQLLQLLQDENTRPYALSIAILSSVMNRSPLEEFYLKLLLDPSTRPYAKRIAFLSLNNNRTAKEQREFTLLNDPHMRAYATEIIAIEFKERRSPEDNEYLKILFNPVLRPHAKLIMEKIKLAYENLSLEEIDILMSYYLDVISPIEPFGKRIQSAYLSLSFLAPRTQMSSQTLLGRANDTPVDKKELIRYAINVSCNELLEYYLQKQHVNDLLRNRGIEPAKSDAFTDYKERNKRVLSFYIIKYFYMTGRIFSEQELEKIVLTVKEKICSPSETKKCFSILVKENLEYAEAVDLLDTSPRLSSHRKR